MNSLRGQNFGAPTHAEFCNLYARGGFEVDNPEHLAQVAGMLVMRSGICRAIAQWSEGLNPGACDGS